MQPVSRGSTLQGIKPAVGRLREAAPAVEENRGMSESARVAGLGKRKEVLYLGAGSAVESKVAGSLYGL